MKVVFIGASAFGMKCLQEVLKITGITVAGVISSSKNIRISSKDTTISNVRYADFRVVTNAKGIPYYELAEEEKCSSIIPYLEQWTPDLILVSGWYRIIPQSVIKVAKLGAVGLHGSLLPKYRGGAPLVWSMINGEEVGGISLFCLSDGIDTGDLIAQKSFMINFNDTIATSYGKMEQCGLELLKESFSKLALSGELPKHKQAATKNDERVYWPMRTPEDGCINWNWSALKIYNFIRAQTEPYPGAFTYFDDRKVFFLEAKIFDFARDDETAPGEIIGINKSEPYAGIVIGTSNNDVPLLVTKIRVDNKTFKGENICSYLQVQKGSHFKTICGHKDMESISQAAEFCQQSQKRHT